MLTLERIKEYLNQNWISDEGKEILNLARLGLTAQRTRAARIAMLEADQCIDGVNANRIAELERQLTAANEKLAALREWVSRRGLNAEKASDEWKHYDEPTQHEYNAKAHAYQEVLTEIDCRCVNALQGWQNELASTREKLEHIKQAFNERSKEIKSSLKMEQQGIYKWTPLEAVIYKELYKWPAKTPDRIRRDLSVPRDVAEGIAGMERQP